MQSSRFDPRYKKFQELLRQYRQMRKLTQLQLAEQLERPQSFVAKYESGERRLDLIEFLQVAEVLDIDLTRFIQQLKSYKNDEPSG